MLTERDAHVFRVFEASLGSDCLERQVALAKPPLNPLQASRQNGFARRLTSRIAEAALKHATRPRNSTQHIDDRDTRASLFADQVRSVANFRIFDCKDSGRLPS